jgi:Restriction endonuclease
MRSEIPKPHNIQTDSHEQQSTQENGGRKQTPTPPWTARHYESLVKLVFEDLFRNSCLLSPDADQRRIWHGRKYVGKSGHEHEIDVSLLFDVGGISFLILIECKHYQRSVEASDILQFCSRIEDIGAQKGILVTTKGFQRGAQKIASAHGIALVLFSHRGLHVLKGFGGSGVLFDEPMFTLVPLGDSTGSIADIVNSLVAGSHPQETQEQ